MKIAPPLWSTFGVVLLQTTKGDNCRCRTVDSECRPSVKCLTGQTTICDAQIDLGHGVSCTCHCLLHDVATADQEEVESADTYSFTVQFASVSDIDQATAGGGQLCIFKGMDKEPDFQPVWVGTMPTLSTEFLWEIQYGVFATDQEYESGVTLTAKSWEDALLTGCYALNDLNGFDDCGMVADDEIHLQNTKSDPTAMGLYQSVVYTGLSVVPGYTQPFYSKLLPLEFGSCDSQAQASGYSGHVCLFLKHPCQLGRCFWCMCDTVDTSGNQVVSFDSSRNTFVCPIVYSTPVLS